MRIRSKLGDRYSAEVIRGASCGGGIRLAGNWLFECQAPLIVSDPGAVLRLLGDKFKNLTLLEQGCIAVGEFMRAANRKLIEPYIIGGGNALWADAYHNLITTEGITDALAAYLDGQSQTTLWYVGLTNASPTPAAGDTMASHGGWTEYTNYSEANRQQWVGGTAAAGSIDNSANKAVFSINGAGGTVGGAFLTSNNTKSGTTGKLYSIGALSGGNRSVTNGDTLNVTATFTAADDGV